MIPQWGMSLTIVRGGGGDTSVGDVSYHCEGGGGVIPRWGMSLNIAREEGR